MRASISPLQALHHASDFTGWVWRQAWAIQLLAAIGPALVFAGLFGAVGAERAADLVYIGAALTIVTAAPLAGAILRLRLGGRALEAIGPGGLQFGLLELRLLVAALGGIAASLFACLPVVAMVAAVFVVFHGAGVVHLQGVGEVPASFLIAGAVVAGAAAAYAYGLVRLLMTLPASVARSRLAIAEGWRLGAGAEGAVAGGLLLSLLPVGALVMAVLGLETHAGGLGWAWQDAALAGAVVGGVLTFVQAPLALGLLGSVFLVQDAPTPIPSTHSRRLRDAFSALGA